MFQNDWIDNSVILDFEMPKVLKNTIIEIEEAYQNKDDIEYNILSDTLDVLCKHYCAEGILTKKQWDLVCQRYPMVSL